MFNKSQRSFTLIELLVVIAIVGLLASIVLVALGGTQAQARDGKRKAELDAIRKALAIYYTEHDQYPKKTTWAALETNPLLDTGEHFLDLVGEWLPTMPIDPLYGQTKEETEYPYSYQYKTNDDATEYKVHAELEAGADGSHEVYSDGGEGIVYEWLLSEETCNALPGWHWYTTNGRPACWSKALVRYVSWNKGVGSDAATPGTYICAAFPNTLKSKMVAAAEGNWYKIVSSVNGVDITSAHNGQAGCLEISALAITDCIDGNRDLCPGDGCLGSGDINAVNISLQTWASAAGQSALPYCSNGVCDSAVTNDYHNACEQNSSNDLSLDCFNGTFFHNLRYCGQAAESEGCHVAACTHLLSCRSVGMGFCFTRSARRTDAFGEVIRAVVRP